MDNKTYLSSQQELLSSITGRLDYLKSIASDLSGSADSFDFAFAELLSYLNDATEFSISTPEFTPLVDCSPHSMFGKLCNRAARAFRAPYAHIGFGGSSLSLLMTIGKILPLYSARNRSIALMDSLCHQSVLGGIDIANYNGVKINREYVPSLGVAAPINFEMVKTAVEKFGSHNISTLIYNPVSYDGLRNRADEKKIFYFCEEKNITVIGDFAWSPYYGMEGYGEESGSLIDHCHISVTSPHKKGLFPSPTSVILYRDKALQELFVEAGRLGWATTSPSYQNLMLVDFRLALIETGIISERLSKVVGFSQTLRAKLRNISDELIVLDPLLVGADYQDPAHILLSSHQSGLDCRLLARELQKTARLDLEKSTKQTVLFLAGGAQLHQIDHITSAFSDALSTLKSTGDE